MISAKSNVLFIVAILAIAVVTVAAVSVSSAMSAESSADTGTLSGTVTRAPIAPVERPGMPSSAPAAGVNVIVISSEGKEVSSAVTDSEGKYSISLPPGAYRVHITPSSLGRPGAPVEVSITRGKGTTLDLRIDTRIR
jgi:Carboxypeptidase regulatory-like domain